MGISQTTAGQGLTALMVNQLPVVVSYLTTGSVTNSAAETVIGTFTIPAGDPTFPGGYWWSIFGTANEAAAPTIRIRLRLNGLAGTTVYDSSAITMGGTGAIFVLEGKLYMDGVGASTTFSLYNNGTNNFNNPSTAAVAPSLNVGVTINTTVSNTLVVTAQYGTASASNTAATKSGAMYRL